MSECRLACFSFSVDVDVDVDVEVGLGWVLNVGIDVDVDVDVDVDGAVDGCHATWTDRPTDRRDDGAGDRPMLC